MGKREWRLSCRPGCIPVMNRRESSKYAVFTSSKQGFFSSA